MIPSVYFSLNNVDTNEQGIFVNVGMNKIKIGDNIHDVNNFIFQLQDIAKEIAFQTETHQYNLPW